MPLSETSISIRQTRSLPIKHTFDAERENVLSEVHREPIHRECNGIVDITSVHVAHFLFGVRDGLLHKRHVSGVPREPRLTDEERIGSGVRDVASRSELLNNVEVAGVDR